MKLGNDIILKEYEAQPDTNPIQIVEKTSATSVTIKNLYGLLLTMLKIFNLIDSTTIVNNNATNDIQINQLILIIDQLLANDPDFKLKRIYNIMISFKKFDLNGYSASASINDIDKLAEYINALARSDVHLQAFYDKHLQNGKQDIKDKWNMLIQQLTKLQLLIFIKKNKEDNHVIDNLMDALNGKMQIVNNILAQNVSDGDVDDFNMADELPNDTSFNINTTQTYRDLDQIKKDALDAIDKQNYDNIKIELKKIDDILNYIGRHQVGGTLDASDRINSKVEINKLIEHFIHFYESLKNFIIEQRIKAQSSNDESLYKKSYKKSYMHFLETTLTNIEINNEQENDINDNTNFINNYIEFIHSIKLNDLMVNVTLMHEINNFINSNKDITYKDDDGVPISSRIQGNPLVYFKKIYSIIKKINKPHSLKILQMNI